MSKGYYGNIKPANINITTDIDIFYSMSESRGLESSEYKKLETNNLTKAIFNDGDNPSEIDGVFNLSLPVNIFGGKGYYTIYMKPKEFSSKIVDIGNLSFYNDVKGIIISSNTDVLNDSGCPIFKTNGDACGYRIDLKDENGKKIPNEFMIITSNNRVLPVEFNMSNNSQKSISYRFDDNSNLWFVTATPTTTNYLKENDTTLNLIGKVGQEITISNTFFNPKLIELDVVENDFDTLAIMVGGSQTRSIDDGILTTYDNENNIYSQHEIYTLKDRYTGKPIYEIKENKESLDITKDLNVIKNT